MRLGDYHRKSKTAFYKDLRESKVGTTEPTMLLVKELLQNPQIRLTKIQHTTSVCSSLKINYK